MPCVCCLKPQNKNLIIYKLAHSVVLDTIKAGFIGLIKNWCFNEFIVSEKSKDLPGFLLRRQVSFHDLKCVTATRAPVRTRLQRYHQCFQQSAEKMSRAC